MYVSMAIFHFRLTLIDTVGYGDQINKEDSFDSIVDYIDKQFEAYLQDSQPFNLIVKLLYRPLL